MASTSTPRWDSLGSAGNIRSTTTAWDLRWWILLAIVTSGLVHAGLFFAIKRMKFLPPPRETAAAEQQTGEFEFDTVPVSVPENLLQEVIPEPKVMDSKAESEVKNDTPDVTDLAEAIKNRDVVLTPTITSEAANLQLSRPAPGAQGDPVDLLSDTRTSLDTSLPKSIMNTSTSLPKSVSNDDDLMKIDAAGLEQAGADLKGEMMKTLKKGTGGGGGIDGFANLDDLVNFQGPIVGDFKTMLRSDLLFDFGSPVLREDARLSLIKLGSIIQSNPDALFRLVGHTDTIGDEVSNQRLSELRAEAVKVWLVERLRVNPANVIAEGLGEREPLESVNRNGTAEQQALNRRVEIHKTSKR